jgi:hypothetical protein
MIDMSEYFKDPIFCDTYKRYLQERVDKYKKSVAEVAQVTDGSNMVNLFRLQGRIYAVNNLLKELESSGSK